MRFLLHFHTYGAHRHDTTLSDLLLALAWGGLGGVGCDNVLWL